MAPHPHDSPRSLAGDRRHAHHPAGRPRQGHGPRPLRRRPPHGRSARRPRAAEPARPRADHLDRHLQGRAAPRREGRRHPRGLRRPAERVHPGRRDDDQLQGHGPERPRPREGAVRGPSRGRGRRDQHRHRQARAQAHRGEVRDPPARHRRGGGHAARRAAAARRPVHRRRRAQAGEALERRQADRDRPRRHRGRLRQGGRHRRARVQYRPGAPGLHRAARHARQRVRGRLGRGVVLDAGPLHRARPLRPPARHGHRQGPRDRLRDRRRLRRQDGRLPRAARGGAVEEGQASGEDGHVARGRVQVLRPDLGRQHQGQDGRDEGRQVRRGLRRAEVPGGRLPWLPRAARRDVRVRAVRHRERQGHRLRRGLEPAEGRRVPGARRADLRVRRRERGGRDREEARDRSGGAPAAERGAGGHQGRLRPEVRAHRPHGNAPRRREDEPLLHAARASGRAAASPRASGSTSAARRAPRSR